MQFSQRMASLILWRGGLVRSYSWDEQIRRQMLRPYFRTRRKSDNCNWFRRHKEKNHGSKTKKRTTLKAKRMHQNTLTWYVKDFGRSNLSLNRWRRSRRSFKSTSKRFEITSTQSRDHSSSLVNARVIRLLDWKTHLTKCRQFRSRLYFSPKTHFCTSFTHQQY